MGNEWSAYHRVKPAALERTFDDAGLKSLLIGEQLLAISAHLLELLSRTTPAPELRNYYNNMVGSLQRCLRNKTPTVAVLSQVNLTVRRGWMTEEEAETMLMFYLGENYVHRR
jgi:hypothetical protein